MHHFDETGPNMNQGHRRQMEGKNKIERDGERRKVLHLKK
jgi:hypothetical protein